MQNLSIFNELSEHILLRINACREIAHPGSWVESKQHLDYDLWYVHEGRLEIRTRDHAHKASAGDLVLFSPTIAYTASTSGSGCRFLFTHFDFGLGNHLGILDNFDLSGILPRSLVQDEVRLFLDAYEPYNRSAPMSGIRLKGCLTILIAKIIELYGQGNYRGSFLPPTQLRKISASLETLQPVFAYIEANLHRSLRVGDLAAIAGMSEKYFILYFKQAAGVTPGLYLYQLKMNRARELLYSRSYSIQQIAELLGYPDPFSFSKAFKKYYKVPPSKFAW